MDDVDDDDDLENVYLSPEDIFTLFMEADNCDEIVELFQDLLKALNFNINNRTDLYRKLKSKLTSWKCQSLWDMLDSRAKHSEYGKGNFCKHLSVLVIGSGPIGLRTAIEAALLGCRTVVVDKRTNFTRNNVLHLWPFLITDFKGLGAKKFYGKFGAGSIDHISIKTLQLFLLKVCLLLGVEVCLGVSFEELIEPTEDRRWRAKFIPENHFLLSRFEFDVVVGADGKKNVLPGFKQIEMRGALAIGITCNFVNNQTIEEKAAEEISGIAYQFQPKLFDDMYEKLGIKLENFVYYKDETHYFVMTATKKSLKGRGVLKQENSDPSKLLAKSNIDLDNLIKFAKVAVHCVTTLPSSLVLDSNSHGYPDVAVFDFTSIKKASNASRIFERKGVRLLTTLVGDSLLEPFWPTGSGCGRGVLSALDTAWMIRQYALKLPPLYVLRERENIFKLLSGTNPESLQKNHKSFTIDPFTRYSTLNANMSANIAMLKSLYDTDDPENADYSIPEPTPRFQFNRPISMQIQVPKQRKKSGGGVNRRRSHSTMSHKRRSDRTTLKEAKHVSKTKLTWETKFSTTSNGSAYTKNKPSGSGTSCSVSESEREESEEQEKRFSRMESAESSMPEVFSSSNEESEEMPPPKKIPVPKSRFRRKSKGKSATKASTSSQPGDKIRSTSSQDRINSEKELEKPIASPMKTRGGVMSFLFSSRRGRKDSESEKRQSVIASRKSVGRARRSRLGRNRRKSGSKSGDEKENSSGKSSRRGSPSKERFFKSGDKTQSAIQLTDDEGLMLARSCKDLVAEMNARDKATDKATKDKKNANVNFKVPQSSVPNRSANGSSDVHKLASGVPVKRKAAEFKAPEAKTVKESTNSEEFPSIEPAYIPLLDILRPIEFSSPTNEYEPEIAVRQAALLLLAFPLLLPCKPRPVNWLERNAPERLSMEKKETRMISSQRSGSVLRAVQEYKTKLSQEQADKKSYYEFIKQSKSSNGNGNAREEASLLTDSTSVEKDHNGFEIIEMKKGDLQPKEVIDAEKALLDENLHVRRSRVSQFVIRLINRILCLVLAIVFIVVILLLSVHYTIL